MKKVKPNFTLHSTQIARQDLTINCQLKFQIATLISFQLGKKLEKKHCNKDRITLFKKPHFKESKIGKMCNFKSLIRTQLFEFF